MFLLGKLIWDDFVEDFTSGHYINIIPMALGQQIFCQSQLTGNILESWRKQWNFIMVCHKIYPLQHLHKHIVDKVWFNPYQISIRIQCWCYLGLNARSVIISKFTDVIDFICAWNKTLLLKCSYGNIQILCACIWNQLNFILFNSGFKS